MYLSKQNDDIQFIICPLLEIQFGPVRSYIDPARYACIFACDFLWYALEANKWNNNSNTTRFIK